MFLAGLIIGLEAIALIKTVSENNDDNNNN